MGGDEATAAGAVPAEAAGFDGGAAEVFAAPLLAPAGATGGAEAGGAIVGTTGAALMREAATARVLAQLARL
jgi:hypothetical protein